MMEDTEDTPFSVPQYEHCHGKEGKKAGEAEMSEDFFCVGISAFSCLVCRTALHFCRLSKALKENVSFMGAACQLSLINDLVL